MFTLIDWYASSWGLLICAITEIILVMWVYGFKRFLANIKDMGIKIPMFMKVYWVGMWVVVTPLVLIFVLIMTFVQYGPAGGTTWGQEKYTYPDNIQAMGWLMAFAPVAIIIVGAIYQFVKRYMARKDVESVTEILKGMFVPNEKWCSAVEDANKNRNGIANVSYIKDEDTIKY